MQPEVGDLGVRVRVGLALEVMMDDVSEEIVKVCQSYQTTKSDSSVLQKKKGFFHGEWET